MQKKNTAQKGEEWNCQFRGCGSYYGYSNECLLVKELHLKNKIGKRRNWAKEQECLQSALWQDRSCKFFFFFFFWLHRNSWDYPAYKCVVLFAAFFVLFPRRKEYCISKLWLILYLCLGLCSSCYNSRIILLVCWYRHLNSHSKIPWKRAHAGHYIERSGFSLYRGNLWCVEHFWLHYRALTDRIIWVFLVDQLWYKVLSYSHILSAVGLRKRNIQSPPQWATTKIFKDVVRGGCVESSLFLCTVRSSLWWGIFHYLNSLFIWTN